MKSKEVEPTNSIKTNEPSGEVQEVQFVTKVQKTESLDTTEATSNSVTTVQEVLSDMMGDEQVMNYQKLIILILEKQKQVGGLAQTKIFGEYRYDIGPHRFFTKNDEIYEIIFRYAWRMML